MQATISAFNNSGGPRCRDQTTIGVDLKSRKIRRNSSWEDSFNASYTSWEIVLVVSGWMWEKGGGGRIKLCMSNKL